KAGPHRADRRRGGGQEPAPAVVGGCPVIGVVYRIVGHPALRETFWVADFDCGCRAPRPRRRAQRTVKCSGTLNAPTMSVLSQARFSVACQHFAGGTRLRTRPVPPFLTSTQGQGSG